MTVQRYRTDNPRSAEDVAEAIEQEIQQINNNAPVVPGTQNYAFSRAVGNTIADQQEVSMNQLYDAAYIVDASDEELTKGAREIGVIRQQPVAATGVARFYRETPVSEDRNVPTGTIATTGGDDPISFETTQTATLEGPTTETDDTEYTTTSTSFTVQTTFTVDVEYRDSIDVSGDIMISDNTYTAHLDVADATNGVTIQSYSTQATSLASQGPDAYDTSGLSGEIDIEFRLRTTNSSGTATLQNAQVSPGGQTATLVNIECTETGPIGNVGQDTLSAMLDNPPGIQSVTNPEPTGDPSFTLADGTTPLTTGEDRENDTSLRERALETTAIGGAGTAEAVELALENIEDVINADVFTNRADGIVDNVDPWHTEVRVYGGDINDIAIRLYEVMTLGTIKTLDGGANGTLESTTLTVSDLYGDLQIGITRPTEVNLDIEIDVVHDSTYSGRDAVADAIVGYIGGTTTGSRSINGVGQNENVLVNEVENNAEDVSGVDYADVTLIDDNDDGTDDTTTDSDGVPVYDVGISDVAIVDASNITVNETSR